MIETGEALSAALSCPHVYGNASGYRHLLDVLPAAIYTTDAEGTVTFANRAAAALAGREPRPGIDKWCVSWRLYRTDGSPLPLDECPMAIALKERRAVRDVEIIAERPDGQRLPVMPFPTPLFDADGAFAGAINVLMDVSGLKHAQREEARRADVQAALYQFTDRLYRTSEKEEAIDAALDAILSALKCTRASILLMDKEGVARFVGWRGLSDEYRRAVEGHCPWKMGDSDPQPIFVPDIELADEPEALKAIVRSEQIRALAFIPIVADGGVIGKFMTYDENSHIFSEDERSVAVTIARQLGFSIERRQAEAQRDLMVAELNHRVKNTLASVVSIAHRSFDKDVPLEQARRSFEGRIQALSKTHSRLAETNWSGVSVREMLEDELAPYKRLDEGNVALSGPGLTLDARSAVVLGMAFHELATNAAKYGALSGKSGSVSVTWTVETAPDSVHILWTETGGPLVTKPKRSGFGRLMLEHVLTADLDGEVKLEFQPEGVACNLVVPLIQRAVASEASR